MQYIRKIVCKIFGHEKMVVNDIIDRNSKDRLCIRCGWNNFNNTSPWRYVSYSKSNGMYHFK
jgi:hypothetical protein